MGSFYPSRAPLSIAILLKLIERLDYSLRMSCSARNQAALTAVLLCLLARSLSAQESSTNLPFADGRIACTILARSGTVPDLLLSCLPVAMNAALETVGAPTEPAHLTIQLQDPPSFYKRFRALFRTETFAIQRDNEIELQAGDDPLKLSFRLGHELTHWLTAKKYPVRPPLWLDEGLAQFVGASAAQTSARVHKQSLERPAPANLVDNLFRLEDLVTLQAYPAKSGLSAAFYWQTEALVRALRQRLGPAEFSNYLACLCTTNPPGWQVPLRERWYFTDWDMNWLANQIRPGTVPTKP